MIIESEPAVPNDCARLWQDFSDAEKMPSGKPLAELEQKHDHLCRLTDTVIPLIGGSRGGVAQVVRAAES